MIYLDAAATMPIRDGVADRLAQSVATTWGAVSGSHEVSRQAKNVLEESRERLSNSLSVHPDSIVFTSGATESLNIIIQGFGRANPQANFFYSSIEHAAVTNTAIYRTSHGHNASELKVSSSGIVNEEELVSVNAGDLVCVMPVNNEIGVINNVERIAEIVHERGAYILLDGVQSFYSFRPDALCAFADFVVFSGHKLGAPKGVGVAMIKNRGLIDPLSFGGSQEWELRPGTTPAYLIESFVQVFSNALETRDEEIAHIAHVQNVCIEEIAAKLPRAVIHAGTVERSPHVVALHIPDVEAQMLVTMLDNHGVCVSKGSACASGASTPSHVLIAMGIAEKDATSTIRFSFSHRTTAQEVREAMEIVRQCVDQLTHAQIVSA